MDSFVAIFGVVMTAFDTRSPGNNSLGSKCTAIKTRRRECGWFWEGAYRRVWCRSARILLHRGCANQCWRGGRRRPGRAVVAN